MNCMDNIENCKASCCRWISFTVNSIPGDRIEDYYRKHGAKLKRLNRSALHVAFHSDCAQLEGNLCKLHGTDKKPLLCRMMNQDTCDKGMYYLTEGCIYKKGEK